MNWSIIRNPARNVFTRAATVKTAAKKKNTVIALFGWAGARDSQLEKYSKLYNKRGYDTLRFTSKYKGDLDQTLNLKDARDVSPIIKDVESILGNRDNSIAFHLLSMNGAFTLCSLHLQYPELDILGRTSGIFFDSAPVYYDLTSIPSYMTVIDHGNMSILTSGEPWRIAKYQAWKFSRGAKVAAHIIMKRMCGVDFNDDFPYNFLRDQTRFPKHLSFVYSDIDKICPAKFIAEFAEFQRKERKADVEELRFTDSNHVLHLRKHPVEYNAMIDRFLERITGDTREDETPRTRMRCS